MAATEPLNEDFQDHYTEHLAEVNDEQEVISDEDIVNENGVLLCKKGMRINRKTADKLLQHKLTKPIEDSVKLSDSIENTQIYKRLLELLEQYPDLQALHNQHDFAKTIKTQFLYCKHPPIVLQKLTVIRHQLPEQLDKAIFCSWLSMLIALEMGMDPVAQKDAFYAGLLHDLGFIHLSPDLLRKPGSLEAEEWRAIQSHVVIGKMMLEKYQIPEDVSRAVLEHHERCNGSGYPANRNDETLGVLGQVVGLADSIYSIRTQQFEKHGRNLYDLLPYMQMNAFTFFYDVYKAMDGLLKRSGLKATVPENKNVSEWANNLLIRSEAMNQAIGCLKNNQVLELTRELGGNRGKALYKITHQLLKMTTRSGMVETDLQAWLKQLTEKPEQQAAREMTEIELMLNELRWQLNNACKTCNTYLDRATADGKILFNLREAYNGLTLCLGELEDRTS